MDHPRLKVLSWNVNGLRNRVTDVHCYVMGNDIDVVALQETGDRNEGLLKLNGYKGFHLFAANNIRGTSIYVKNSIPAELVEPPSKTQGIESVCVKLSLREGEFIVVNLYVSRNCFDANYLPDCIYTNPSLVIGDLNARHTSLGTVGSINANGVKWLQFLQDHPDTCLLGNNEPTHIRGGRLDYACVLNSQGIMGEARVVRELLSDHFALNVELPLGKKQVHFQRKRLNINKDMKNYFIQNMGDWYQQYTPLCVDSFYEDMVENIEKLVQRENNGGRGSKTHGPKKFKYSNDQQVKGWERMLRSAHKEWLKME